MEPSLCKCSSSSSSFLSRSAAKQNRQNCVRSQISIDPFDQLTFRHPEENEFCVFSSRDLSRSDLSFSKVMLSVMREILLLTTFNNLSWHKLKDFGDSCWLKMKTVGVLGLGPAGIVTVKELKAAGIDVTGFDRNSDAGGRWSLEGDMGIYKELHLNGSRRYEAFSDFPWEPDTIPDHAEDYAGVYPHCSEAKSYFQAYCKHFDLLPNFQLSTEIVSISETDDKKWVVVTRGTSNQRNEATYTFDALVVCTGNQAKPVHPLKDTVLSEFTGRLLHSAELKSMKEFQGQKVLVVGSSISGADATSSLVTYGGCSKIVNCIRKLPYHAQPVSSTTGNTLEDELFSRLAAWADPYIPAHIGRQGLKGEVLKHWPQQVPPELADGLEPHPDPGLAGFSPSRNYVDLLLAGKFSIKAGLASAKGSTVTFNDGTKQDFDAIICCTGYEADLSFLPKSIFDKVAYTKPHSKQLGVQLYKHTLVPGVDNLAFAGIADIVGSLFPAVEMQARLISATFSGKVARPSLEDMKRNIDEFNKTRDECPFGQFVLCTVVSESIAADLGLAPSFWHALCNPKKLLLRPIPGCYYRTFAKVDGAETAKKFAELFDYYIMEDFPQKVTKTV